MRNPVSHSDHFLCTLSAYFISFANLKTLLNLVNSPEVPEKENKILVSRAVTEHKVEGNTTVPVPQNGTSLHRSIVIGSEPEAFAARTRRDEVGYYYLFKSGEESGRRLVQCFGTI